MEEKQERIRVYCRFRPPHVSDTALQEYYSSTLPIHTNEVTMVVPSKVHTDTTTWERKHVPLDQCFYANATQQDIFEHVGKPLIAKVMEGVNASFLAYGYSGTGKTFSTLGSYDSSETVGLLPRMIHELYSTANQRQQCWHTEVSLSVVELYQEKLFDLLAPKSKRANVIKLREAKSGVFILPGCTEQQIDSEETLQQAITQAIQSRSVRGTALNERSSRSHMICMVKVVQNKIADEVTGVAIPSEQQTVRSSILYVVDLAGSENVERSGVTGVGLDEAKFVNLSLTTLSRVIHTLNEKQKSKSVVVPYRESILTRMLRSSLGGNALSAILLTCSPDVADVRGTWLTLLFGCQAQAIVNTPTVNLEMPVAEYQKMVASLQTELSMLRAKLKELEEKQTDKTIVSQVVSPRPALSPTPKLNLSTLSSSGVQTQSISAESNSSSDDSDAPPPLIFEPPRRLTLSTANQDTALDDAVSADVYWKLCKHLWLDSTPSTDKANELEDLFTLDLVHGKQTTKLSSEASNESEHL